MLIYNCCPLDVHSLVANLLLVPPPIIPIRDDRRRCKKEICIYRITEWPLLYISSAVNCTIQIKNYNTIL